MAKRFIDGQEVTSSAFLEAVGTVSESGGVPTGAIIESGSNANGKYIKYADGTMICQMKAILQGGVNSITLDYPQAFYISSNNRRVANREITTLVSIGATIYDSTSDTASAVGTQTGTVALVDNTTPSFNEKVVIRFTNLQTNTSRYSDCSIMAIGRWY